MDTDKFNRQVNMLCPTCGCDQFEFEGGAGEALEMAKCASCGREMTKDELINENSENISEDAKELGEEAVKEVADEFRKSLKKAFRGSKNIKIK